MKLIKSDFAAVAVLSLTGLVIFREYFSGSKSPSWDFLNDYFTASFVWWNSGSFFNPPSYLPYAFSGFPAHLSGQAANWYLPVGLLAELKIYNIHTSAILQAITIIFGLIGIYFLAKSWQIPRYVSLLLALAYLFSPGFFTSASHIDIVRGWAFMPWILLALKPLKDNSIKSVIAITFLSFQYMVGVYPGIIIASVYILFLYVSFNLLFNSENRRNYFLYQIIPFAIGIAMSFLKWLPLVTQERLYRGGNTVEVTPAIISTLIYPYDTLVLPNDITMRSLFLAPIVILSVLLIQKINKSIAIFAIIAAVSIFLGFDFSQTNKWQEALPFLGESRFRTTDFKLFWTLSLLMLAGLALQQVKAKGLSVIRGVAAVALAFLFFTYLNRLARTALLEDMLIPGNNYARIAGITFSLMVLFLIIKKFFAFGFSGAITLAIVGTLVIGYQWSELNKTPWSNDRVGIEQVYYGMEVDKRIGEGEGREYVTRPGRIGPEFPIPYPIALTSQMWSNSEINKTFSLGGYVPLKGIPRYESMIEFAKTEESVNYFKLLAQAQTGWIVSEDTANKQAVECITNQSCLIESTKIQATSWELNKIEFAITNSTNGLFIINEIPWQGWKAEVCSEGDCETFEADSDIETLLLSVPVKADTQKVIFSYEQPLRLLTWVIFWISILAVMILLIVKTRSKKLG